MFLNNIVKSNEYTLPKIERIIELTQGMRFFTVVDMKHAYFQIKLRDCDKEKTAFRFENKLYQFCSLLECLVRDFVKTIYSTQIRI